jgi:hypothetical protein
MVALLYGLGNTNMHWASNVQSKRAGCLFVYLLSVSVKYSLEASYLHYLIDAPSLRAMLCRRHGHHPKLCLVVNPLTKVMEPSL